MEFTESSGIRSGSSCARSLVVRRWPLLRCQNDALIVLIVLNRDPGFIGALGQHVDVHNICSNIVVRGRG